MPSLKIGFKQLKEIAYQKKLRKEAGQFANGILWYCQIRGLTGDPKTDATYTSSRKIKIFDMSTLFK